MRSTAFIKSRATGRRRTPALGLLLALAAGPLAAGTTGQLRGVVVDEAGTPLSAVLVTVASPSQIGGEHWTETDSEGVFLHPRLAPGVFTVRLELPGYATLELTDVRVRLDRTTEVQVTLPAAAFADELDVVEGTPVVDPTQVSTGQTFTPEYMEQTMIGTKNRLWIGMLGQTAGVAADSDGSFPLGIRVFGSTFSDSAYLIDGVDSTDPYQGTATPGLNTDALQEVVFHTSGFEAEYGRATGGVVNMVTKSGGNRFSGSLDLRYRDSDFETKGSHYDPDTQRSKNVETNATLGGPIVRDRMWFFASLWTHDEERTPTGSPSTKDFEPQNYIVKLTGQPGPAWSLAAKYVVSPYEIRDFLNPSPFIAPEARMLESGEPFMIHLDVAGVLSSRLLWSARAGHQAWNVDQRPADGDLTTIGHFNLATGESYGNEERQRYRDAGRSEVESSLTWLLDTGRSSHELKAGLRYSDLSYRVDQCFNGSGRCAAGNETYLFQDLRGAGGGNVPGFMLSSEAAGRQVADGAGASLYVQDAWRALPGLTLKAGVRWDRVTYDNDTGREVLDLAQWQPRLGLAWDLAGDGRNILRASIGRYMHPSSLAVPDATAETQTPMLRWLSCSTIGPLPPSAGGLGIGDPRQCAGAAAAAGFEHRLDQEGWDPAGWYLPPTGILSSSPARVAPGVDAPYADQISVGLEREIVRGTSLEASFVYKETRDLIEDTCNGNLPDPTAGAACDYFVFANLPEAKLDFRGWLLRFESRPADRLHLLGSYLYSEAEGSIAYNIGGDVNFDVFPDHFVNRYGYVQDHSRHRIKVDGYFLLPFDLTVGLGGSWRSELPWTPQDYVTPPYGSVFVEPRGSRDVGDTYSIDLQLSKGLRLGSERLALIGTVYNLLDTEQPTAVCDRLTGCGAALRLGDPLAWQQTRSFEVGVRYEH